MTQRPSFASLGHIVVFVQPFADYDAQGNAIGKGTEKASNETYVVDVGFGSHGLIRPILLADTEEGVMGVSESERHRLKRSMGVGDLSTSMRRDGSDEPPLSSWDLQFRYSNDEWRTLYTFTETEFFLRDYMRLNAGICHAPSTLFWNNVLAVRYVDASNFKSESESEMERIILLGNEVKAYGETRVLRDEIERIQVLKEEFRIDVGAVEEAIWNIKGRDSQLVQS
ncbi:hypothetical protein AX16_004374 [Volvariella volvacea WC 439]|nr:hypothetical protein AX16_004374 [Volvariella volvacea WC 439]